MGMFGAALATGISSIISIIILLPYLFSDNCNLRLSRKKIELKKLHDIFSLGITSFVTEFSSGIALILYNLIILGITGNIGVAAYGIVANIALVVIAIFTGVSQGIQPIVSREYGLKNLYGIKKILKYGIISSLLISAVIYGIIFKFSDIIITIFNSEKNIMLSSLTNEGLKIYFLGFFPAGINIVFAAYLGSIEKVKKSFIISMLRGGIILVPVVLTLSVYYGMRGVWFSFIITEIIVFLINIKVIWKQFSR
jgi:Na+-driven multidrug efflux pump